MFCSLMIDVDSNRVIWISNVYYMRFKCYSEGMKKVVDKI